MKAKKKAIKNKQWKSVAQIVVTALRKNPKVQYEAVTAIVRKYFPKSRWQETHFRWYRSALRCGRIGPGKTHITRVE